MTHTPFYEHLEQLLYISGSYDEQHHEQVHEQLHPEMSNFEVAHPLEDAHEHAHEDAHGKRLKLLEGAQDAHVYKGNVR